MSIAKKAFEYWYSDKGTAPKAVEKIGGNYKYIGAHSAWTSWEAAWNEAIEQAAKTAEAQRDAPECPERAQYCADAIRTLIFNT